MDKEFEGFPGSVLTYATFSVQEKRLTSRLVSIPLDKPTPIMLANHIYWNLDAFVTGPKKNILDNTLYMPYSKRYIEADGILIPTGKIVSVEGTPLDFTKPKKIGTDIANATACGTGCVGYDNAFIIDRPRYSAPEATDLSVLQLASPVTGIAVSVKTNQQSLQIYSCVGQNGTIPVKASQQHGPRGSKTYVEKYGCVSLDLGRSLNPTDNVSSSSSKLNNGLMVSTIQNGVSNNTKSMVLILSQQHRTLHMISLLSSSKFVWTF